MTGERRLYPTREAAESLAIAGLSFLANNPEALARFLALTGIGPQQLRHAAADPGFLAAVLEHYLADEPLLLAFAADAGVAPSDVGRAHAALSMDKAR